MPMTVKTKISSDIDSTQGCPTADASIKKLLANKKVLAWILRECTQEFANCAIEDIADKYIEGEPDISSVCVDPDQTNMNSASCESISGMGTEDKLQTEGTVFFDLRFFARVPKGESMIKLIVNVEAQNDFFPGYPLVTRGIYYCSRMLSSQKGVEFSGSNYEQLKKVYSIWICTHPPTEIANSLTKYYLSEDCQVGNATTEKECYDLLSVIMVYLDLKGSKGENDEGLFRLLNTLLCADKGVPEKKKILSEEFGIEMSREFEKEVSLMCNVSYGYMLDGMEKGLAKGRAEGIAEGRVEGIAEGRADVVKLLMSKAGLSAIKAMEYLGVPADQHEQILAFISEETE